MLAGPPSSTARTDLAAEVVRRVTSIGNSPIRGLGTRLFRLMMRGSELIPSWLGRADLQCMDGFLCSSPATAHTWAGGRPGRARPADTARDNTSPGLMAATYQ